MLALTEFSGRPFWLNPDHLLRMDAKPDTTLTLTSGDKVLVRESTEEVMERFVAYKQRIHKAPLEGPPPGEI